MTSKEILSPKSPKQSADEKAHKIRIGHYVLGETLGQGSFGKVKLAEHEITGHKVAVKMINRQKIQHKQMDKKIRREIKILKLLRHPHIIRLYEVIETGTDIFLIMEYVGGGELFEYIVKHGRLSIAAARRFFQEIICAVEHTHYFRVVHRDLKPENVLLDEDANVKIADFGLSNLMADGDFLQTSCGSPNYAAPEVISGKLYAGPEVDVWSCGVILYALLCGRLPFDEDSVPALFKKIKEGLYVMPHHLPPQCIHLISSMLVVDPLKRITIPQIREHPWFKESLPPYLNPRPDQAQLEEQQVDMELLRQIVTKLDIPLDIGIKALVSGVKNDLSVAYYILLDGKRKKSLTSIPVPMSPKGPVESNPPKLRAAPIMEDLQSHKRDLEKQARESYNEPTIRFGSELSGWGSMLSVSPGFHADSFAISPRSSSISPSISPLNRATPPGVFKHHLSNIYAHGMHPLHPESADPAELHENWRLGLFTELSSNSSMSHIYQALKELRLKWKVVAPFHLFCIREHLGQRREAVGIQLYRMSDRHDKGYFIDLAVLGPDVFPTIDFIYEIYVALSRNFAQC